MAKKKSEKVGKVDGFSADVRQEKINALKQLVPEAFSDGRIDVKRLRKLVGEEVVTEEERYRLEWSGKSEVFDEIAERSSCTLTLDEKRSSKNWKDSDNIFIEGENLEVLRTLQKAYSNQVKMIYIDPPYNTGKDFVYNDNFRETEAEYCEDECNVDDSGLLKKAYKLNTKDSGRFHSNWLSMMYPRLYLARNLLKEDGVIFVSIDDNEVHNLRMIMNEIFGEENFIGNFTKQSKVGGGSDSKFIVQEHEYCVVYGKNISNLEDFFVAHDSEYLKRYKELDEKGRYFWDTLARRGLKNPIRYEVVAPDGTKLVDDWNRSKKTFEEDLNNGEIKFKLKKDGSWNVYFKQRLNVKGKKPRSMTAPLGGTIEGKQDFINLFNNDRLFSYPKSVKFLKYLNTVASVKKNDVVLDFFSGSGTTAHAVMQQNAEDGGSRKYICVQMPEETPSDSEASKAGYKKISDIAIDRIKKAAAKIKKDHPDFKGDLGVRVYKETESHFPQWQAQTFKTDEDLKQAMLDYSKAPIIGSVFDRATEVLLKLGYPLTTEVVEKDGYMLAQNEVALVLDSKFAVKNLQKVIETAPKTIIVLEKLFKKDEEKINFALRCKEAGLIFQTV